MDKVTKKTFISKWADFAVLTSFAALVCILFYGFSFISFFDTLLADSNNERDFYSRYSATIPFSTEYNEKYLTHRLIKMDVSYGIATSDIMNKALRNVNHYLESVDNTCPYQNSDQGTFDYITCANKILHDNFYYTPSVEVSNNYAIHRSDCDTNTYLMMDAMKMKGISSYIVYAPGHAFLAWKDSFGNYNYQETTWDNNKGKVADLSIDWYTKTFDRSYYTPMNDQRAENIYNALIYNKSEKRVDIDTIYNQNKDNSIISDWYFSAKDEKNEITKDDAKLMLSLLYTDFTSTDKKMSVLHYLMQHDQKKKALAMLDNIPAKNCGRDCFIAGAELGRFSFIIFKKPFLMYDNYLKSHALSAKVKDFRNGLMFLGFALALTIVTVITSVRVFRKKKNIK